MKNLQILGIALFTVLAVSSCKKNDVAATDQKVSQEIAAVGKSETASFNISGMSCAVMCANKIEKELADMKGIQKASVDFDKKMATVTFDSGVLTPEKIVAKVESVAGGKLYKVSNLKTSLDKAMLFGDPEKEKKRAERKAARAAKKAAKNGSTEVTKEKSGCCSGKKSCSKDDKSGTM